MREEQKNVATARVIHWPLCWETSIAGDDFEWTRRGVKKNPDDLVRSQPHLIAAPLRRCSSGANAAVAMRQVRTVRT